MFRRFLAISVAGAALWATAGCNNQPNNVVAGPKGDSGQPDKPVNIGAPLFPPKPLLPATQPVAANTMEPMLIPAHTSLTDIGRIDLPAMRDSRILFIGTELKPGEQVDPSRVKEHRKRKYRRLEAGEPVAAGSVVMLLDDSEAWAKLEQARVAADSAVKILEKAKLVRERAEQLQELRKPKYKDGSLSAIEFIQGEIEVARAQATESSQEADLKKAQEEFNSAQINYAYFTIHSDIGGILQPFNQHPGQSVKALESVMQVQNTSMLRAEGLVSMGYFGRLKSGMPVTIEPTVEEAPAAQRKFHTLAVNGVAVSNNQP